MSLRVRRRKSMVFQIAFIHIRERLNPRSPGDPFDIARADCVLTGLAVGGRHGVEGAPKAIDEDRGDEKAYGGDSGSGE